MSLLFAHSDLKSATRASRKTSADLGFRDPLTP